MPVQQLHHQASKALECTGDAHGGADPDEDVLCSLDVDLELASLVDRRVEESKQTLWHHVSPRVSSATATLAYVPGE